MMQEIILGEFFILPSSGPARKCTNQGALSVPRKKFFLYQVNYGLL